METNLQSDLLEAVKAANLQTIEDIFSSRLPPLQESQNWSTLLSLRPLEVACEEGHVGIVEFLLKQGNPENYSKDPNRTTLLHRAVKRKRKSHLETVEVLLKFATGDGGNTTVKTYVNIQDEDEKTALHHAAERDYQPMVKLLLQAKADMNIQDKDSKTALHHAAERDLRSIARLLIQENVEVNTQDKYGKTALHHAAERGYSSMVGLLQEYVKVNIQDRYGKTALHYAAERDYRSIVGSLLEAGADVTIPDNDHLCAAQAACVASKYETMRTLFEKNKARLNAKMEGGAAEGYTCLQLLTNRDSGTAVKYLLGLMGIAETNNMNDRSRAWRLACGAEGDSKSDLCDWSYHKARQSYTAIQRFPINLEAAIALIAHEFGSRHGRLPFSWDESLLKTGITCYSFRLNHFRGIYALLGELLDKKSIEIQDVKQFINGFENEQYIVDPEDPSPAFLKLPEPFCTVPYGSSSKYFTIAMPYFKVMSLESMRKSRKCMDNGYPLSSISKLISLRYRFCPSYSLESLKAPYMPLTLDEYCCPALPISMLNRRNDDQVLIKATKSKSYSGDLVTVCQLWTLQFEKGLIVAHERDDISSDLDSDQQFPTWGYDCTTGNIKRCIGVMLSHFIDSLDRSSANATGSRTRILNTFEHFIARIAQEVDEYSRRKNLKRFNFDTERQFLHDIDDIRGELRMIMRVILQQEEVWKTFASNAWPEYWKNGLEGCMVVQNNEKKSSDEWHLILRPQSQFNRFRSRIAQLDEDAARIEKSIVAKLDLKQKHASLQEAHATAVMSAAVLGFTVITIIFTPLSFVTSLFALAIDRFQKNQVDFFVPGRENEADFTNRTRVYTTNYIGKWAGKFLISILMNSA
ncbi:hypothetical protein yc1106_01305 [Curvularia clavata]|uniref:Uncharacterized protein n=1 Tax=Curvularia clavata TaxID=95742 RepID=A0A9Q9DQ61_CURCL|nr:hypothetical protein yc1106_01305 [Curvularia clavata]